MGDEADAFSFSCGVPAMGSADMATLNDLRSFCQDNGLSFVTMVHNNQLTVDILDTGEPSAFERLRQLIELRYKELML